MRLEREHRPRDTRGPGDTPGLPDHRLVAEVNAVEIADGDGPPANPGGQMLIMAKQSHSG
jgi:hypothetical protein